MFVGSHKSVLYRTDVCYIAKKLSSLHQIEWGSNIASLQEVQVQSLDSFLVSGEQRGEHPMSGYESL